MRTRLAILTATLLAFFSIGLYAQRVRVNGVGNIALGDITATSLASTGAVSGTTGAFTAGVSGTTGVFSGAVSGTTGTFTSTVVGVAGTFSGALSGTTGAFTGALSKIANITTAGSGVPVTVAVGRSTAQAAAVASVAAFTVGASDASFEVSANILITTATTHSFTATVAYTDEGNTARTATLNFATIAGVISNAAITNVAGAVPYEGVPYHIRAKAATSITIATTGTFTTVAYNVEGIIKQIS